MSERRRGEKLANFSVVRGLAKWVCDLQMFAISCNILMIRLTEL